MIYTETGYRQKVDTNMHSILIVEDDTSINELLKEALEKENYRCTQAFSEQKPGCFCR